MQGRPKNKEWVVVSRGGGGVASCKGALGEGACPKLSIVVAAEGWMGEPERGFILLSVT